MTPIQHVTDVRVELLRQLKRDGTACLVAGNVRLNALSLRRQCWWTIERLPPVHAHLASGAAARLVDACQAAAERFVELTRPATAVM